LFIKDYLDTEAAWKKAFRARTEHRFHQMQSQGPTRLRSEQAYIMSA